MEKVIEEYEKAKEKVRTAKRELWKAENAVKELDDGYIYVVCLMIYKTESWYVHTNPISVQIFVDDYYDGEYGLFHLYTNNPNAKPPDEQGSLRDFKIMTTQELKDMAKENPDMGLAVSN